MGTATTAGTHAGTHAGIHARTDDSAVGHGTFDLVLESGDHYAQSVSFPGEALSPIVIDEPPPLGEGAGPNPARVLGAAVGSCLGASLLFCLRKAHIDVHRMKTSVRGTLSRNEHGRLRVSGIDVTLRPEVLAIDHPRVTRCAAVFEDYCVVTASVRRAIDVTVRVEPVDPSRQADA